MVIGFLWRGSVLHAAIAAANQRTVAAMVHFAPGPMVQVFGNAKRAVAVEISIIIELLLQALLSSSRSDRPVKREHTMYAMPPNWNIFLLEGRQPANTAQNVRVPPMIKAMVLKALALFHLLSKTVPSG